MSKSTSHRTQTFKYKLQPMGAPAGGNSSSNDTHNSHGFGPSGCKKKAVGQNKAGGHGVRGGVRVPCLLQNSSYCLYFEKDEDLSGVAGWMLQGFCVRFRHPYQYICVAYAYVMASATRHEQRQVTKLTEKHPCPSVLHRLCLTFKKASKINMCIKNGSIFLSETLVCAPSLLK